MPFYGWLFVALVLLVQIEMLAHIIYHWKTGKAGWNDPAFSYLKDIWRRMHG